MIKVGWTGDSRAGYRAGGYVLLALPCATSADLAARHLLRQGLHARRRQGRCMRRVVAVGHARDITALVIQLRGEPCHGLVIRLADGGPALFRQTRIGKDGRPFTVLKFRTMVPDAEQRKAALAGLSEADGVLFKIRADPRVTRVGCWLRRWSLDELPPVA